MLVFRSCRMDAVRSPVLRLSLCLSTALLAACGGGGGGTSSALPAMPGPPPPNNGGTQAPQVVAFSIAIPSATASATRRRVAYVSAGTKSATITYGSAAQTVNCAETCNASLQVFPGTQTFTVSLYSAANASGAILSTGSTTATIVAGQNNSVQIVFGGVVAKLALSLGSAVVTAGSATTIPVSVQAIDAAGYTIVGPDPYAQPIALSDDDTSGVTRPSTTTVTSPQTTVALAYSGAASIAAAHLSATVPGTSIAAPTP